MRLGLLVEVAELGVRVGMLATLEGLGVGLQAEPLLAQQPGHRVRTDPVTRAAQLGGQPAGRQRGPAQRRAGSPRRVGATSASSAASSAGSVAVSGLRPPPARRTRPSGACPASSSATPWEILDRNVMHKGLQAPGSGCTCVAATRSSTAAGACTPPSSSSTAPGSPPRQPTGRCATAPSTTAPSTTSCCPPTAGARSPGRRRPARWPPRQPSDSAAGVVRSRRSRRRNAPDRNSSQVERLQALARLVELVLTLVGQRLEISERETRRAIDVWGASGPPARRRRRAGQGPRRPHHPGHAVLAAQDLMDAWCALWFWPVDAAGLLDGSNPDYAGRTTPRNPSRSRTSRPRPSSPTRRPCRCSRSRNRRSSSSRPPPRRSAPAPPPPVRTRIPLADLDDWIEFAEALVGRADIPEGALFQFHHPRRARRVRGRPRRPYRYGPALSPRRPVPLAADRGPDCR
jgi:hypothetical protein